MVNVDVYLLFDVLTVQLYKVLTKMLVIVPVNSGFSAILTKCLYRGVRLLTKELTKGTYYRKSWRTELWTWVNLNDHTDNSVAVSVL